MGQSLNQFLKVVEQIQEEFANGDSVFIQKCFSSPHFLILQIRKKGKTAYFYLGRGGPFQGIYLSDTNISSEKRVIDRFLEFARSNWRGSRLVNIEAPFADRVLSLSLSSGESSKKVFFFWRGKDLFFAHFEKTNNKATATFSWSGIEHYENVSEFNEDDLFRIKALEIGLEQKESTKDSSFCLLEYQEKPLELKSNQSKVLKKAKRKEQKIKEEIERNRDFSKLYEVANDFEQLSKIDHFNFYGKKIKFFDCQNIYQKRDKVFSLAKRLKKGLEIQEARLRETKAIDHSRLTTYEPAKIIQPIWNLEKKQKKQSFSQEGVKKVFFMDCHVGWIGLNSGANDYIRSKLAQKEHLWFHLDGYQSSHFIYNQEKRPSIEEISCFASMMRDTSHLEILEIPLVYTQVKNLKGLKGKVGAVLFKKEKRINAYYEPAWRQKVALL